MKGKVIRCTSLEETRRVLKKMNDVDRQTAEWYWDYHKGPFGLNPSRTHESIDFYERGGFNVISAEEYLSDGEVESSKPETLEEAKRLAQRLGIEPYQKRPRDTGIECREKLLYNLHDCPTGRNATDYCRYCVAFTLNKEKLKGREEASIKGIFKEGVKVRILGNRKAAKGRLDPNWVSGMDEYIGEIATIKREDLHNACCWYLDNSGYYWHEEWLEIVPDSPKDALESKLLQQWGTTSPHDNTVCKLCGGLWGSHFGNKCRSKVYKPRTFKPIETQKGETTMRKAITEVFENTKDAVLVEKYAYDLLPDTNKFLDILNVTAHKDAILAEAERLEEIANKED